MDGRGRIAQPLSWFTRLRARPPTGGAGLRARPQYAVEPMHHSDFQVRLRRCWGRLLRVQIPRGLGAGATVALILGALIYGTVKGEHVPDIVAFLEDTRDQAANAVGFRIADLELVKGVVQVKPAKRSMGATLKVPLSSLTPV